MSAAAWLRNAPCFRAVCAGAILAMLTSSLCGCAANPRPRPHGIVAMICSHLKDMDLRHDGKVDFEEYSNYLDAHGLQDFNPLFGVIDAKHRGYIDSNSCAHASAPYYYSPPQSLGP